jgi:hypothetical protein
MVPPGWLPPLILSLMLEIAIVECCHVFLLMMWNSECNLGCNQLTFSSAKHNIEIPCWLVVDRLYCAFMVSVCYLRPPMLLNAIRSVVSSTGAGWCPHTCSPVDCAVLPTPNAAGSVSWICLLRCGLVVRFCCWLRLVRAACIMMMSRRSEVSCLLICWWHILGMLTALAESLVWPVSIDFKMVWSGETICVRCAWCLLCLLGVGKLSPEFAGGVFPWSHFMRLLGLDCITVICDHWSGVSGVGGSRWTVPIVSKSPIQVLLSCAKLWVMYCCSTDEWGVW